MTEYIEIYGSLDFKLYGRAQMSKGLYSFHVETRCRNSDFPCAFSGTGSFCIPDYEDFIDKYCNQLKQMYNSLNGECRIVDYDYGNELHLFFEKRTLKIEGKFQDALHTLKFSGEADQTIIPPIISLLQQNRN